METIEELIARYPGLAGCASEIEKAAQIITETYRAGHSLYSCGNGGSCADSDHIVGELMKGFLKKRPVPELLRERLNVYDDADFLAKNLQCGLPAISLHSQSALLTAFANDVEPSMIYAQVLYALGKPGDVLMALSTSGNSGNILNAAKIAKASGLKVIALTGASHCRMDELLDRQTDCVIHVGETETYRVQELHLPVYHWLCGTVEDKLFGTDFELL